MAKRLFYTRFAWHSEEIKEIERSLKLFALINTELVVPSNHLYSENAEYFFNKNPELLEKQIIRPSLDSQYGSYSEYFENRERKAGRSLVRYGAYLDSLSTSPINYSDTSPAGIFTDCAIEQLENPNSVLANAAKYDFKKAEKLLEKIEEIKLMNNGVVYFGDFLSSARGVFSKEEFLVIDKFAQLNRYVAGASSKECNNLLPQENMIDWCLANPDNPSQFILNDEQIFWEVFIESLVKVTGGVFSLKDMDKISPRTLDKFSFYDIQDFRENGIIQSKFIEKYDSIIDKINKIKRVQTERLELVDFEYLIKLREQLRNEFENSLKEETTLYTELELIEAVLKVAYQLWGSALQTVEAVVNFFTIALGKKKSWDNFLVKQEQRINAASKFVSNRISGKPILIEYMNEVVKKSKEAWYK